MGILKMNPIKATFTDRQLAKLGKAEGALKRKFGSKYFKDPRPWPCAECLKRHSKGISCEAWASMAY